MFILGLTGAKGAGKTTVAEYLEREHGFYIVSFADPLKKMMVTANPIIGLAEGSVGAEPVRLKAALEDLGELEVKKQYPEYRRLLEVWGTNNLRHTHEDFWVDLLFKRVVELWGQGYHRFVIPDVRFPNEAQIVRYMAQSSLGYSNSVALVDDGTRRDRLTTESEMYAGHLGETDTLFNDKNKVSKQQLFDQVEELLASYKITGNSGRFPSEPNSGYRDQYQGKRED